MKAKPTAVVLLFLSLGCIITSVGSQVVGCNLTLTQNIVFTDNIHNMVNTANYISSTLILNAQEDLQKRLGSWTNISVISLSGDLHCKLGKCNLEKFYVGMNADRKVTCILPDIQETPGYAGMGTYLYDFNDDTLRVGIDGITYVLDGYPRVQWDKMPLTWEQVVTLMSSQPIVANANEVWISPTIDYIGDDQSWIVRIYKDQSENMLISQINISQNGTISQVK